MLNLKTTHRIGNIKISSALAWRVYPKILVNREANLWGRPAARSNDAYEHVHVRTLLLLAGVDLFVSRYKSN